jgi:hypothetical protein
MFTLLESGPSKRGPRWVNTTGKAVDTHWQQSFVRRSNGSHFRTAISKVKRFLCAAQYREFLDKTKGYEVRMTFV